LVEAASGLIFLHNNKIIHQDIKPQNLIVSRSQLKITDFGEAIMKDDEKIIEKFGKTLLFAPPEVFNNSRPKKINENVDIY